MTCGLVRENGFYSSFCPLSCVSWLAERLGNVFFLTLGTASCAYFLQTPRPLRLMGAVKWGSIVFEEADIAAGVDEHKLAALVGERVVPRSPEIVFLLGSCFIEIQKIDLEFLAARLTQRFGIPFVPARMSGFDDSYSHGEDALLAGLIDLCPPQNDPRKELVIAGTLPAAGREMFVRECRDLGIPLAGFLPDADKARLPPLGGDTLVAPLHPSLCQTLDRIARTRGSAILAAPFPYGPDGTAAFLRNICAFFGRPSDTLAGRESRAWEQLSAELEILKGRTVFFSGDNLTELPLARLMLSCGASVAEAGTPYVHSRYHKAEFDVLAGRGVPVVEAPDNVRQLERILERKPDLVVTPLSLSYPLEKMGFKVLWSVKLFQSETCYYGFDGAELLVRLFSRSIKERTYS